MRARAAGFYKAGGTAAGLDRVQECLEAVKMRGKEVRGLLQQALAEAESGGT